MNKPFGAFLIGITLMGALVPHAAAAVPAVTEATSQAASIGSRILTSGQAYLGTPYKFGSDPSQTQTFDCSSFTFRIFTENGINLPRTANQQMSLGTSVSVEDALPGDLVFFRDPVYPNEAGHVSVYVGNGKILHASSSGKGVGYSDLSQKYWKTHLMAIKRVIPATYTVRPGDTLWSVSLGRNATVQELRNWNKLKQDMLTPGQQLMTEDPDLLMSQIYAKGKSRVVQPGDTLWTISRLADVTIDQLRTWNQMTGDAIQVGQRLKLEAPMKSYTVVSGDSLWAISNKTRTPEALIRKANQLAGDSVYVGQVLKIPVLF
ncbi:LysM peptidoglycan-binding domain-containing protein [Gorillibacterium sp. sgz5001074]|uniref:C40 family peptidase n=1 Tax=Gorillibacterium sp. sgz5001074 TaxID=3446695 RepID=UPI003F66EFD2